ncbi:unknown [Bacteroides sp. CAG:927]|nr:unknown [Bacteroides sp. CAG:927]
MFGKSDVLRFGGWQPEYYEFLREKFCLRLAKMKIRGQFADKNRNEKSLFIYLSDKYRFIEVVPLGLEPRTP